MISIALEEKLPTEDIPSFTKEFSQYNFISLTHLNETSKSLDPFTKHSVQVYFGSNFPWDQIKEFPQLKWIHTETPALAGIDTPIVITSSTELYADEIAELMWTGIQMFGKKLHLVHDNFGSNEDKIWSLNNKTFLQIGLGAMGSLVAKSAATAKMKTWGMQKSGSYHPNCKKTFSELSLHALLPHCDIISISPDRFGHRFAPLDDHTIKLMKKGIILSVCGTCISNILKESCLKQVDWSMFRGLVFQSQEPMPKNYYKIFSQLPNCIIIPETVNAYFEPGANNAFRLFRNNLRTFSRGDLLGMEGIVYDGRHPS